MRRVVTVVSKEGCHLCEKVIEALRPISSRQDFELRVLDINEDEALHDKYFLTIPVVLVHGRQVFDANDIGYGTGFVKKLEDAVRV